MDVVILEKAMPQYNPRSLEIPVVIPQIWGCECASALSHPQIWDLLQKFLKSQIMRVALIQGTGVGVAVTSGVELWD
jgi:hypothetical protein